MKPVFKLIIVAVCSLLFFTSCREPNDFNEEEEYAALTEVTEDVRNFSFEINDDVERFLSPDNNYLALIDDLYVAANTAFSELSLYDDRVYDAAIALSNKQSEITSAIVNEKDEGFVEEFREWMRTSSLFDAQLGCAEIAAAGYEESLGEISSRTAFCKMLRATDSILSFYYKDYQPIFVLPQYMANDILLEFDENELSAELKYKDELISVDGYVKEITKDVFDKYYISLGGNSAYGDELRCYFDNTQFDAIANVSKGDRVSMIVCIREKELFDVNATLWEIKED